MSSKAGGSKGPKIALAATALTLAATPAAAQKAAPMVRGGVLKPHLLLKQSSSFTVAGMVNGRTVLRGADGALFYLDPKTGDAKALAGNVALKQAAPGAASYPIEHGHVPVTLVGVDAHGHTLMRGASGETFYLDARTGDMVFVK